MKTISMTEALEAVKYAETCTLEERLKLQKERLKELVEYARANSPYLGEKYKELPDDYDLKDIPPSSKKEIMEHFEEWVSDSEVKLEGIRQYLDSEERFTRQYLGKYSALTTSGSTGNPFVMVRDSYHNTIHGALMSARLMKENAGILDLSKNKIASLIFTDPHVSSYSSLLRMKEANKEYADNIIAISPLLPKDEIVKQLNEFNPDVVSCYPSALYQLVDEKTSGNLKIKPKGIFCSAELLTGDMHELLMNNFECPVYNNYCSTEGGEAAMASGCCNLHINEDWVIIEPVNEKGEIITSEDELSSGILITDLSNYIQPIIRYRMDDCVRIHKRCECGNPLPYMEIYGRDTGTIDFAGQNISLIDYTFLVESILGTFKGQFIKKADRIMEIRSSLPVSEGRADYLAKMAAILRDRFDSVGCTDYELVVSMEDPMRNKRGGKVPNFVNEG